MANKINSNAMRLGFHNLPNNKGWKSVWFAKGKDYTKQLHEDLKVKRVVEEKLKAAGIDNIIISRPAGKIEVEIFVGRPGVAIGRGGEGIDVLTKDIKRILQAKNVDVKVKEVRKADLSARILAQEIGSGLERRMPVKLLVRNALQKAMNAGAKGIRIWVGGRINGAQQARVVKFSEGPVPLHTLKANIDYANVNAETLDYGKFGIKIWVNHPDE